MKLVSEKRVQQRTAEAQFTENFPKERISERTQIVDEPVPQIAKKTVEAVRVVQRERMQQRTVDAPTPQVLEETIEVGRLVLHEDAPQSRAEIVEARTSVPHESEVVAGEQRQLVLLGVFFRRWTWSNSG